MKIEEVCSKISLKRIAEETGVCYPYLLKSSKKPIEKQPYDASATNYGEMLRIIEKKVKFDSVDWEDVIENTKKVEPLPGIEVFEVGTRFTLRNDQATYEVIYRTETHVVFLEVNGLVPRVMNDSTFLHQSPRIKTEKE